MTGDRHDIVPAVESTPVESGLRLWWLGGPSYVIRTPQCTIYVDPYHSGPRADNAQGFIRAIPNYFFPEDVTRAEVILSTHNHEDHCDPATLGPLLARTAARIGAAPSSARKMADWDFARGRVEPMAPGATLISGDVTLLACPSKDWEDEGAVTFVLSAEDRAIFIGGDTLYFEGLGAIGQARQIDLAVLALARNRRDIIDAPLYLDPAELAHAARTLGARRVLPVHWDIWQAWAEDPHLVAPHLAGTETELVLLAPGDSIAL